MSQKKRKLASKDTAPKCGIFCSIFALLVMFIPCANILCRGLASHQYLRWTPRLPQNANHRPRLVLPSRPGLRPRAKGF